MTFSKLVLSNLRFYWRTHLGVLLGSAVACAVLVGAMAVGDSVTGSLHDIALERLGEVRLAIDGGERLFRAKLADDLAGRLNAPAAGVLKLSALAATEDGSSRAHRVNVLGVDAAFWKLAGSRDLLAGAGEDQVVLNAPLARQLGVKVGDTVRFRVDRPSLLPADAPLATESVHAKNYPLTVIAIAGDGDFGRFSLENNQAAPRNAFVPRDVLAKKLGLDAKANLLLVGAAKEGTPPLTVASADAALRELWQLADAGLELRELKSPHVLELRSDRVFLDPAVVAAVEPAAPNCTKILTYFATELRVGEKSTPYSVVAASAPDPLEREGELRRRSMEVSQFPTVVPGPRKDPNEWPFVPSEAERIMMGTHFPGIILTDWVATDLDAKPGQRLTMKYLTVGPMRNFQERTETFTISRIVPLSAGDREMLPDFPGLANIEDMKKWKPGIPIDQSKIRPKDDAFWRKYRGTPKAYISLPVGQRLWGNRFGNLTAIRWDANNTRSSQVSDAIRKNLAPESVGLHFAAVRDRALAASGEALDFGQLFLGLSFFLIAAAVLLTAMLFALGVQQRQAEAGLLLAVGWRAGKVRAMLLWEGAALAVGGALIGTPCGLAYTRGLLWGLSTAWSGAVAGAEIRFHVTALSTAIGAAVSVLASLGAIYLATRWKFRASARSLLAGGDSTAPAGRAGSLRINGVLVAAAAAACAACLWWCLASGAAAEMFFLVGTAALLLVVAVLRQGLLLAARGAGPTVTLGRLAMRNAARRVGRSLGVMTLLACGAFLIVAVAANEQGGPADTSRSGGTGGFALWGESDMPILRDLNDEKVRKAFNLDPAAMAGVRVVPLRVQSGDDASCFNLNRAQQPRLLGVLPEDLAGRFHFIETASPAPSGDAWSLLEQKLDDGAVPAIGDEPTVTWGLGKSLGGTLDYTDEQGHPMKVRIVGILGGSIFQGSLLISRANFEARFPSRGGYRAMLVDSPAVAVAAVSRTMTRGLEDLGLELRPAPAVLAEFGTVQDTYLRIFLVLGGLGMLLGVAGLALVVVRNVMERRGELAILQAVGLTRGTIRRMVLLEHAALLALAILGGAAAGASAVLPVRASSGAVIPYGWLGALLVSGLAWTALATFWATRGQLLAALRNE